MAHSVGLIKNHLPPNRRQSGKADRSGPRASAASLARLCGRLSIEVELGIIIEFPDCEVAALSCRLSSPAEVSNHSPPACDICAISRSHSRGSAVLTVVTLRHTYWW